MFSVIIPLYNKAESIVETVHSVLGQSFAAFELVIVDDGSTDNSLEIVQGIADERIVIVRKPNGGVSSARNAGIAAARYDHVAFLDGDDIWHKDFLFTIREAFIQLPEAVMIGTAYGSVTSAAELERGLAHGDAKQPVMAYLDDYFSRIRTEYFYCSSAVVIRKSLLAPDVRFNEQLSSGEDLDMWFRIAARYRIGFVYATLAFYRLDAENRAMNKVYPFEKHLVSVIYNSLSPFFNNGAIAAFTTFYLLDNLRPYYFNDQYKEQAKGILKQVGAGGPLSRRMVYRLPYVLARALYDLKKSRK